jgi:hypothetical protein
VVLLVWWLVLVDGSVQRQWLLWRLLLKGSRRTLASTNRQRLLLLLLITALMCLCQWLVLVLYRLVLLLRKTWTLLVFVERRVPVLWTMDRQLHIHGVVRRVSARVFAWTVRHQLVQHARLVRFGLDALSPRRGAQIVRGVCWGLPVCRSGLWSLGVFLPGRRLPATLRHQVVE